MKKRLIGLALVMVLCMTALAGCGKKVKCSFCGETKSGKTKTVLGQKVEICNDCIKEIENFMK